MSGQYCIWQHISWQGGWGSLMSNAMVPTFSHVSMRTAVKNMPGMKELMHLHGLLSMMHSSTQHIAVAIHNGSVQFVVIYPVMRHMCWHVHIAQVVVRHFALHPQVLSWLAHYLSVRCTCQDWERGFRKCWLTWSWWGNEVGTEFYDRGIQPKCVVPQTRHCYHRGPNHARTHPAGSSARTDFIAIDHIFARGVTEDIDLSVIRRDHEWVMSDLPICICEREVQVGTPMSMTMEHTFNPLQRSVWYQKQSSKPRKAYLPHETWQATCWQPCHWKRFCQTKRTAKQAVTCSVLCVVFSRPSWDRRSSLATPGRWYFCIAYSSSRYPEWLDSYASWPDLSNPSKSGTQKSQQKGIASQCLLQVVLKCWRG